MDLYVCQAIDYFTVSVLCSYCAIFLVKLRSTDAEVLFSFFFGPFVLFLIYVNQFLRQFCHTLCIGSSAAVKRVSEIKN